jgi:Domain of unknown function (DUF4349)
MHAKRFVMRWWVLATLGLAACSGSATPQLISSYPRAGTVAPVAAPSRVYNTSLDVEVPDVDSAAQQAVRLAAGDGGYLVASQPWYQAERRFTTLTLSVPADQFDSLRSSLIDLGRLVSEQLSSQPAPWPSYARPPQSIISVTFTTASPRIDLPALPNLGWSPVTTFSQAFGVFASIFTVLIDVIIWVTVVVGPFVLMGLGLRWLLRLIRRPA